VCSEALLCTKWRLQFMRDVCQSLYSPKGMKERCRACGVSLRDVVKGHASFGALAPRHELIQG